MSSFAANESVVVFVLFDVENPLTLISFSVISFEHKFSQFTCRQAVRKAFSRFLLSLSQETYSFIRLQRHDSSVLHKSKFQAIEFRGDDTSIFCRLLLYKTKTLFAQKPQSHFFLPP
jgi:hypothetical protein